MNLDVVKSIYQRKKRLATCCYNKKEYKKTLFHIDSASIIAHYFNWIYKDDELEQLLHKISIDIFNINNKKNENFKSIKGRVVFYDQIGRSGVLAEQYIRALKALNLEFLYIIEKSRHTNVESIINEIEGYDKATFYYIEKEDVVNELIAVRNKILNFAPEKVLLHSPAEGAFGVVLWNSMPFIKRFRIVPGDHHFYLGTYITDIAIEFRNYGYTIALQKRGFKEEQVVILPYYPILKSNEFEGFPVVEGSFNVKLFSGSALYKIYDKKNTFLNLVKEILEKNPSAIMFFAGSGNEYMFKKFINFYGLQKRIILLGYRNDISGIFSNIDLYIGTYPMCGGLMSQYASIYNLPIFQYNTKEFKLNEIEGILRDEIEKDAGFTYYNRTEFIQDVSDSINSKEKRNMHARKVANRVITFDAFNANVESLLHGTKSKYEKRLVEIDYNEITKQYLEREGDLSFDFFDQMLMRYGAKFFIRNVKILNWKVVRHYLFMIYSKMLVKIS